MKADGEKGSDSEGGPDGKRAAVISRVRNSSELRSAGSWTVLIGVLGEKKLKREVVAGFAGVEVFASTRGRVGCLDSFVGGRSGEVDRIEDVGEGMSVGGTERPTGTGAEYPENQPLIPPFALSTNFVWLSSLSPVNVGMNS